MSHNWAQGVELREDMSGLHLRIDKLNYNVLYGSIAIYGAVVAALIGMAVFGG
jgi:hypothetical protein